MPAELTIAARQQACVFALAHARFAVDVAVVTTIASCGPWRRLPATPPAIIGAVPHPRRPQALAVIDLARLLDLPGQAVAMASERTLLLLELPRLACAVHVRHVIAVASLAALQPAGGREAAWVAGYLPQPGTDPAQVIDTAVLAQLLMTQACARDDPLSLTATA